MQTDELKDWLRKKGVLDEACFSFDADLGLSGTFELTNEQGCKNLVERIKTDKIKAVLVYQISTTVPR